MKLQGKTALVTGGGRGIGLGCALELARAGANVVLNDRPGSPDLADSAREVAALGVTCTPVEADAHSRAGCEAIVRAALAVAPRIDILVANPARSKRMPFLDFDPADFDAIIHGTLTAGFHIGQLVAREMVARPVEPADGCQGKIVYISSVHGERPYGNSTAYNAAKAGLNHMALTMAAELNARKINVNIIEPGWIDTPGERATFGLERMRDEAPKLPWGRIGEPADIGRAATFLSSDDADYVTGAVLRVDGGFVWKDCRGDSIAKPK
jgi:glucose 1-dehydrogenase